MVGNGERRIDWRKAADYAPLLDADRSILAWEWLRRDTAYRDAALKALGAEASVVGAWPGQWGLCAFEDPNVAAPRARPVWSKRVHAAVLEAVVEPTCEDEDRIDLGAMDKLLSSAGTDGAREHLLLSDGLHAIRLDLMGEWTRSASVRLRYSLAGIASAEQPLLALRRLLALCRTGCFSRSLHPKEPKGRRWVLLLRAHDALAAGAGHRDIAEALLKSGSGAAEVAGRRALAALSRPAPGPRRPLDGCRRISRAA